MAEELDLSKAIQEVQQMLSTEDGQNQIQGILDAITGSSDAGAEGVEATSQTSKGTPLDFLSGFGDVDMLLKLKSVMDIVGNQKGDTNTAFLQALKPFLSEDRRQKIDQAAKILSVTKAIKAFKDSGLGGV